MPRLNENSKPACQSCGVCCFSRLDAYVRVSGDDWARLGDLADSYAHFIGNRAYMRMQQGHCAALEVRHGPEGGREFFCTIYARRPRTCRDLERGSAQCDGERELKAQRVAVQAG